MGARCQRRTRESPAQTLPSLRSPRGVAGLQRCSHCSGTVHCVGEGAGITKQKTPGPALAMWIPTEHEKYGVGKSPRGELLFLSAGVAVHFASLPPRPSRSARQEMPNPGFELRVWGFAEPAPGRGVRVGVSLLRTRLALPARVPGARGQLRGARGQPARCGLCLRSLEWRRGVCVKLEGERKRRSSPSSPSPQRQQWAAKISQAWERPQPRGEVAPETEGSANPSL